MKDSRVITIASRVNSLPLLSAFRDFTGRKVLLKVRGHRCRGRGRRTRVNSGSSLSRDGGNRGSRVSGRACAGGGWHVAVLDVDNSVGLLRVGELEVELAGNLAKQAGPAEEGEEGVTAGAANNAVLCADLVALVPGGAAGARDEDAVDETAEAAAPVLDLLVVQPVLDAGAPVGDAARGTVVGAVADAGMPVISHLRRKKKMVELLFDFLNYFVLFLFSFLF